MVKIGTILGLVGGIFLFIGGIYWAMQVFAAETALYGIYGYRVGAFGMDPTPFYVSYAFRISSCGYRFSFS